MAGSSKTLPEAPTLENLLSSMNIMYERRDARDESRPHRHYLASLQYNRKMILTIARQGTLEECLNTVEGILEHDLEYLAKTDEHRKTIQQHIRNFCQARNNLDALRTRPDEYRI